MSRNTDPFAPWNDPMDRDDFTKPWNDPIHRDDPFAPWNSPIANERDYDRWCDEHHIPERNR
jgi:hypothetical protein